MPIDGDHTVPTVPNSPSNPRWENFVTLPTDPEELADKLSAMVSSKEEMKLVSQLESQDTLLFLDAIDRAMESPLVSDKLRRKCTKALRKICGSSGTLPSSYIISEGLEKADEYALTSGGFADVWRGTYKSKKVAIKAFRIFAARDLEHVKKKFCKEAVVWKRLSHPNVLSFLGVSTTLFQLCMISLWMDNGNICQYLKLKPGANRLALMSNVVRGLEYLHSLDCIHGNLKGTNVLVTSDIQACIADFGLTPITSDPNTNNMSNGLSSVLGSIRWMAPELINPEEYGLDKTNPTKESDIYSLGMVIYEVFSGVLPFQQCREASVLYTILSGSRPERPEYANTLGLSDDVWEMVEACWQAEWNKRPDVSTVLICVEKATSLWIPPPPTASEQPVDESEYESFKSFPGCSTKIPFNEDFTNPSSPGISSESPKNSADASTSSFPGATTSVRAVKGKLRRKPNMFDMKVNKLQSDEAVTDRVSEWVKAQQTIALASGRRHRPGVAFSAKISYIESPPDLEETSSDEEGEEDVDGDDDDDDDKDSDDEKFLDNLFPKVKLEFPEESSLAGESSIPFPLQMEPQQETQLEQQPLESFWSKMTGFWKRRRNK